MVMGKEYKQLRVEEREKIAFYYAQRQSVREIARLVGRDHSTISRELKRNRISRTHARLKNDRIRNYVEEKLKQGWSPEQIAGRISIDHSDLQISHEAIYQWLYSESGGGGKN